MCQLLGLNSNLPTDICFSFTGFRARGGETDHHADGWGIAFFNERGARVLHEPKPSCSSPLAEKLCAEPIQSTNIIAHIRKATMGEVRLENTHPFSRELWGRQWVFAHNGDLADFAPPLEGPFRPVGTTDSELAFCWIMQQLHERFGDDPPEPEPLLDCLREASIVISRYGVLNFLLSSGDYLVAHSSTRLSYLLRKAPAYDPHLIDADASMVKGKIRSPGTRAAIVATAPLTDNEPWVGMPAGTLWCFQDGEVLGKVPTVAGKLTARAAACGGAR